MKKLIMCEGPNELEVIRILLEHDKLIFTSDELLGLVPYHARQIASQAAVKTALNMYSEAVEVLRIGDTLNDTLNIPTAYKEKISSVEKYCTKPELEMLLIISENMESDYEKVKSDMSPKSFAKKCISYNHGKYNNSTKFFRDYYGDRVDLLVLAIRKYRHLKSKHGKDELYLADLLR